MAQGSAARGCSEPPTRPLEQRQVSPGEGTRRDAGPLSLPPPLALNAAVGGTLDARARGATLVALERAKLPVIQFSEAATHIDFLWSLTG